MYVKVLFAVVFATCTAAGLLTLRQQRLQLANEMAEYHQQINDARHQMWSLQVRVASQLSPNGLRESIQVAGLELEPITPTPQARLRQTTLAADVHRHD